MISAIIVGLNEWERYTLPFVRSIRAHDPRLIIVCVDNGSDIRYPETDGVIHIRSHKKRSYAGGINLGLRHGPVSDWYLVFNNDMLLHKCISNKIDKLDPGKLYGFHMYEGLFTMPYMPGWGLFISSGLLQKVGLFDENFAPMWFEDADYCIRAVKAGYEMAVLEREDWGIQHLEDERMGERKGYMASNMDARHRNRAYLRSKHGV